jgi:hypothetical protein
MTTANRSKKFDRPWNRWSAIINPQLYVYLNESEVAVLDEIDVNPASS